MVRYIVVALLVFFTSLSADALSDKIQNLIDSRTYKQNIDFIGIIFTPKSKFYRDGDVDSVEVVKTLKENRLLGLSFRNPHELSFTFKTTSSPLLFVKIMKDALRNIGYYRYVTKESSFDEDGFSWSISLYSKKIINPEKLEKELYKSLCSISDIERFSTTKWSYKIDTSRAVLNLKKLQNNGELRLKRSLYAKWIDASGVKKVHISSSIRNTWYPYIAYYDKSLNLLDVLKVDKRSDNIYLTLSDDVYYIKISDIYTLKNLRDDLILTSSGFR